MRKLTCLLLVLVLTFSLFTLTAFADGDKAEQENPIPVSTLDIATVPDYTGSDYIVLNDNVPDFYLWQITKTPYVRFSAFDELGRTGAGMACLGKETLPAEVRGEIGDIRPTGWHTERYDDLIEDRYLYNRAHVLGYIQKTHLFRAGEYICSRCGASYGKPYKVCPNCPSEMGKSKYDPSWVDEAAGLSALLDDDW